RVLGLLRVWLAEPGLVGVRLVVVTRGAVVVDGVDGVGVGGSGGVTGSDGVDVVGGAVWGLVRSAQVENPGRFVLVDVDVDVDVDGAGVGGGLGVGLGRVVGRVGVGGESQFVVRGGGWWVPGVVGVGGGVLAVPSGVGAWRLGVEGVGSVEGVGVVACPGVWGPLGVGEVRVGVRAAGVNFRDVLIALGVYPGAEGLFGGSEGAGVVLGVGSGVVGVVPGDRVMGLFEGAFGSVAVADARMVVRVPQGWGWRESASVSIAFLTAWYGLVELGGLRAGGSVLIHAATGGVGMAAVQIARHVGAEVFATAGPGKQGVLEEMGVDAAHRGSSRDLEFEGAFRGVTGGRGVDVVLNSLAGEFTDASLRLVAGGGRFVEMGKTDVRDPERVGGEFPGVVYRAFDLVADAGPERVGGMLEGLRGLFEAGVLVPAPVRVWPLLRAREALRFVSHARHVGKVVLEPPVVLDPRGTVLVTGGTGALGALVAEHLVVTGRARRLVLVGRRGGDAPGVGALVERLEGLGARVEVVAADVGDLGAVTGLVEGVDPAYPLTGVVHAAGVVDDGVVPALSRERLLRVWRPKAAAVHHLHRATAHLPLAM
ncbi:KR domain-containing protein, partial [Streptomyces sp. NPDC087844]|uniref:MDR/SDR family oxidoreductase n=1 Tax=Streptomyces sp. NPDC087844 TaxID=3365805 RepID=UPI003804CCCB